MAGEIPDETKYEVVRKYILYKDVKQVAEELKISESSVRNILKEFKAGKFPEYAQFIPHVEASGVSEWSWKEKACQWLRQLWERLFFRPSWN